MCFFLIVNEQGLFYVSLQSLRMASEMSSFGCEMYHVSPRFLGTTCNCHHLRTFVLIHQIQLKTQEKSADVAHNYHILYEWSCSLGHCHLWVLDGFGSRNLARSISRCWRRFATLNLWIRRLREMKNAWYYESMWKLPDRKIFSFHFL